MKIPRRENALPMTTDRQISVYDGQQLLGFLIERSDKSCVAKDASGHKLGSFPNLQKAVAAVGDGVAARESGQRK